MFHAKRARLYQKPHLLLPTHTTPGHSPFVFIAQAFCAAKYSAYICSACLHGLRAPFRLGLDGLTWLVIQAFVAYNVPVCSQLSPLWFLPRKWEKTLSTCALGRDTGAIT